jgi:hypothetical protein|tara:strand:+ start:2131 stop:2265 length:135 start_codon:yes stop_codon:yes gene_type:complete
MDINISGFRKKALFIYKLEGSCEKVLKGFVKLSSYTRRELYETF